MRIHTHTHTYTYTHTHARHAVPRVTAWYITMIIKTRLGMRETLTWKCKHTQEEMRTRAIERHTYIGTYNHSLGKQVEGVHALYFFIRHVQSLYLMRAGEECNLRVHDCVCLRVLLGVCVCEPVYSHNVHVHTSLFHIHPCIHLHAHAAVCLCICAAWHTAVLSA